MTTPDRFRFSLSTDGRQLAVWEPGREPWVVHDLPSPREGGWVPVTEMDRRGWQLFVPVPADRNALRRRIAEALYERERPPGEPHWPDAYPADREVFEPMADAVLAVLPEPTGQTTDQAAGPAALRDAADFYERVLNQSLDPASDPRYCTAVRDVVMGLRRRADEAQPTTGTEAADEPQDAPPREPHPTHADMLHAQAVLDRFYGRSTATPDAEEQPAAGARQDGAQQ